MGQVDDVVKLQESGDRKKVGFRWLILWQSYFFLGTPGVPHLTSVLVQKQKIKDSAPPRRSPSLSQVLTLMCYKFLNIGSAQNVQRLCFENLLKLHGALSLFF